MHAFVHWQIFLRSFFHSPTHSPPCAYVWTRVVLFLQQWRKQRFRFDSIGFRKVGIEWWIIEAKCGFKYWCRCRTWKEKEWKSSEVTGLHQYSLWGQSCKVHCIRAKALKEPLVIIKQHYGKYEITSVLESSVTLKKKGEIRMGEVWIEKKMMPMFFQISLNLFLTWGSTCTCKS